jgi:ribosome-associated toxin RatA of RatAB toxin-antitoxin module
MPRVESSITINGDFDKVYETAKDIESFAQFMPDLKSVKIIERSEDGCRTVSEWVGIVKEFKTTVNWTEEDVWDDEAKTCDFKLVKGDYKSYSGKWTFTQDNGSVRFDSVLDFEYEVPLVGALIKNLIAKKMKENLDNMLLAIKNRVEQE